MSSLHLNILQSLIIVLYPIHQILFLMLVHHLFNLKTRIFLGSLNYHKAHGYDDISIRLLKICDSSIVGPLLIIFKNCLKTGTFLTTRKSQMLHLSKKRWQAIAAKLLPSLVSNLLCSHQSWFCSSDSCQSQLC